MPVSTISRWAVFWHSHLQASAGARRLIPSATEHLTPTTAVPHSGGHHRCISSTGHYYCLIISLLLSLHIILVYIIPYFDVLYSRIGCITDDTSYIDIIFCLNLAFFLFSLLTNSFVFLKHVVSPIRLRLHVT